MHGLVGRGDRNADAALDSKPRNVDDQTGRDLHREMRALLDDEEYENFVAAAARLSRRTQIIK
jgi:hypothetical protein